MTDGIPRHLRLAIVSATRAFEHDEVHTLATINEDIQPLVDAAIAWGRRGARRVAGPWLICSMCQVSYERTSRNMTVDKCRACELGGTF